MASIMTNASAMTALQSLSSTNRNLDVTQSRISTGLRVATASDNAAYWSIATTMRSDNKALSTVQDTLGLGASKVDTAYTGMEKAIATANELKVKLVSAAGATDADKAKIQTEIDALQEQMKAFATGSTFSGSNFLAVTSTKDADGAAAAANTGVQLDTKIVSSFNRDASGAVSLSTIDIDIEAIKLFDSGTVANLESAGILDRKTNVYSSAAAQTAYDTAYAATKALATGNDDAAAAAAGVTAATTADATATSVNVSAYDLDITATGVTDDVLANMITKIDSVIGQMTDAATTLGAAKQRIDLQKEFTTSLMDSIDRGVGQLVDADMNKESTRLQALQVQQQLGIQALSIANSNSQSIMSLFR